MTFNHYADLYLEFKQHELKVSTYDKYYHIVEQRIAPVFNDQNIADIKPSDVKKWLYAINDVGSKSKRHYMGVLSGIFQEAYHDEVITRNPVKIVKLPKLNKAFIDPFNADQVKLILDDAKENTNYQYFLALAFFTGMRSGEIIGLKKIDIDLKNNLISVARSRSRHGESTPKTKYSIREIPIIKLLQPYINQLLDLHDNDYLFVTQYKKPYRDTHVFQSEYWKPSLKKLNIEYRRPYNARHTYATNMLYRDLVSPVQLAQLLGHANTQMVYDVYVNYIDTKFIDFDRSIEIYV